MTLAFRSGLGCAPFKTNPLRLPLVCQQPITVFLHYRLPLVGLYFVRSTPRGLLQTAVSRPSRVLSSSPCALKSRSSVPASLAGAKPWMWQPYSERLTRSMSLAWQTAAAAVMSTAAVAAQVEQVRRSSLELA